MSESSKSLHKTTECNTEFLLSTYPKTRSNDRLLVGTYLSVFHNIKTFEEHLHDEESPALVSIIRCRRKLQSKGLYPADTVVAMKRSAEEEYYREYGKDRQEW